jgi:hypothetical protein
LGQANADLKSVRANRRPGQSQWGGYEAAHNFVLLDIAGISVDGSARLCHQDTCARNFDIRNSSWLLAPSFGNCRTSVGSCTIRRNHVGCPQECAVNFALLFFTLVTKYHSRLKELAKRSSKLLLVWFWITAHHKALRNGYRLCLTSSS